LCASVAVVVVLKELALALELAVVDLVGEIKYR
jgi:hypothetical protein